ncbi:MAG: tetratricopeptide repeat protein [bacterium]
MRKPNKKTEENQFRVLRYSLIALFCVIFVAGIFSRSVSTSLKGPSNDAERNSVEWEVKNIDGGLSSGSEPDLDNRRRLGDQLRADPDNAELHNEMGMTLARDGLFSDAIMHFQSAIEINPNFAQAYHNIGIVHEYLEHYQESQAYLEKAQKLDPENTQTERTLHRIEFMLEYQPDGIKKYETDLNKALMAMGRDNTDLQLADNILEDLVLENPSGIEARNALGVVEARQGYGKKAEKMFLKIINEEPGYIYAYINLATIYESKGDFSQALEYLSKAVNLADDKGSKREINRRINEIKGKISSAGVDDEK